MGKRLDGLDPVADEATVAMILGTFPGPEALGRREYYADPRNQFWSIMDRVLEPLSGLDYRAKVAVLLRRRIGLWDVIGSCEREGALDRAIKNPEPNDLADLLRRHPKVRAIYFNGQKAEKYFKRLCKPGHVDLPVGLKLETLPSSSGANTHLTVEGKVNRWRGLKS